MILDEQVYKKRKLYFHGSDEKTLEKDKSRFNCIYISPDYKYALDYAKTTDGNVGYLYELIISKPLNIFNIRHRLDEYKLFKKAPDFVPFAKSTNWYAKDSDKRELMVDIIKDLGYDGFFDFESEDNSNPSLGIFNLDNLQLLNVMDSTEIKKQYKDLYDFEKSQINSYAENLYSCGYDVDLIADIIFVDYVKTLGIDEIKDNINHKLNYKENVHKDSIGRPYIMIRESKKQYLVKLETFNNYVHN